jgi:predicted solute-binding protein
MSEKKTTQAGAQVLRLGYQDRANFAPLVYAMEAGWTAPPSPWALEIVHEGQGKLLEGLLDGEVDAAFVTPADAQQEGKKITPLGGWGLAVAGRAETALFLSPKRIDLIDGGDVAVMPEAEGSTAEYLLRTLITPYYGIKLGVHREGEEGFDAEGARLVFGDGAPGRGMEAAKAGWAVDDISLAWWVMTGLPMVWEVLCYRRDLVSRKPGAVEAIQSLMKASQRAGAEQASSVVDVAAGRLGLAEGAVKELFGRQSYVLGSNEQKGLARFLDMAGRGDVIGG